MKTPKIVMMKTADLIPYENNPRKNDDAVQYVANSIREFGFKVPIVIDKENVIVAGHTRLKAAESLGIDEVPVIVADDLTEDQVKAFRLADNKTGEVAEWDFEALNMELEDLQELDFDMSEFGFEIPDEQDIIDDKYTSKTDIPQYEPSGEEWAVSELYDDTKTRELIERIKAAKVERETEDFLTKAAYRHTKFNYKRIADFYAVSPKEIQELMEESALVIIDIDDAIKNGYTNLDKLAGEYTEDEK